jgi:hypothetical protein
MGKQRQLVAVGRPGRPTRPSPAEIRKAVAQLYRRRRRPASEAAPESVRVTGAGGAAGGRSVSAPPSR